MMPPGVGEAACREYARHVKHVNAESWKHWQKAPARPAIRTRLGTALIALGLRLAPPTPTLMSSNFDNVGANR